MAAPMMDLKAFAAETARAAFSQRLAAPEIAREDDTQDDHDIVTPDETDANISTLARAISQAQMADGLALLGLMVAGRLTLTHAAGNEFVWFVRAQNPSREWRELRVDRRAIRDALRWALRIAYPLGGF